MRVVIFTDRYLPSLAGPEIAAHGFAAGLVRLGHAVSVVTATQGPPGHRATHRIDGVTIAYGCCDPTFARHLNQKPDFVLVQLAWSTDVVRACRVAGVPVVALAHAPSCCHRLTRTPPDLVIVPSAVLARQIIGRCAVVPPPIDLARLRPPADAPQREYVTAVNLAARKGGQMVHALAARMPEHRFLGIRGGYGEQVKNASPPNLEIRPSTPDMGCVYAASRVVIVPSQAETFGLVAVEAQAAGVPVVASDLPALRDSLGAGALFVPVGDVDAWAHALASLDDPSTWRSLAVVGALNARRYSADASIRMLEEALVGMVSGMLVPQFRGDPKVDACPVAGRDVGGSTIADVPVLCDLGAPGQNAFTDALVRELGFVSVPLAEVESYLWSGRPVLVNGWYDEYERLASKYPGLLHCTWHSGWAGSGLMGEGVPLQKLLAQLAARCISVLWLERRDVPPVGARHLAPVWSPGAMRPPLGVKKQRGHVMAGLHGAFPTPPKNIVATIVGAVASGAVVHVGESTVRLPKLGPVVELALGDTRHVIHPTLSRAACLRLLASMDLLVHPSVSETWPVMILEAAHVGTPAVISDVTAWAPLLDARAQSLCIVRPATSTAEIARLTRHLLANDDDRAHVLVEQQRVLADLLPVHVAEATQTFRDAGFPVAQIPREPDLTVFVLTTGEPSTDECLERLRAQDVEFKLEVIDHVAPMNAAFQAMLDRCMTSLYVQVDADMLLRPNAIRTLRQKMLAQPPEVALYVAWLWGDDVQRPIQGIKIYRHEICRRFPYGASLSCEVTQLQAMAAAGFIHVAADLPKGEAGCVGVHFACQTPEMAYRRWERLCEKHQRLPWMGWLKDHIPDLLPRLLRNPNPINRAAFIGACVGLGVVPVDREMDYRIGMPEFERLWRYFGEGSADARCGGYDSVLAEAHFAAEAKRYKGEVRPPRELVLYLTDKCNHGCRDCKRQQTGVVSGLDWTAPGASEPRPDMEPALVRNILAQFPSIESACLAGFGEPLCHPQLDEIVGVLAEKSVQIGLITNGSLLYHHREMVARWPLAYLSVSLNAVTPEAHRLAAGCATWPAVMQGLRHFATETEQNAGVSFVVHRENVHEIPALLGLAADLGLQFVNLVNLLSHGNPENEWFLSHVLTVDCPEAAEIEAYRALPGAERVHVWPTPIDLRNLPPLKCQSPLVSLGVNSWGHTSLCRRVEDPIAYQGDHFQIDGMWENEQNTRLRRAMAGDLPLPTRCRKCFGCWAG